MAADSAPMAADISRVELDRITSGIIGAGQKVSRVLGVGFLEKVYENALFLELVRRGFTVEQQRPLHVYYERGIVGAYVTDLLVNSRVLVELKAQPSLDSSCRAQCIHYLRGTGLQVCLLLNFGRPRMEIVRVVNNF